MDPAVSPHDVCTDNVTQLRHEEEALQKLVAPQAGPRNYQVTWSRVLLYSYLHFAALYGLYLLSSTSWTTIAFNCLTYYLSIIGITAGVHRLWSHRSYKAKRPLQVFLMLCFCLADQHTIFLWVRDHRLHHKYSDTDADPHNATRGLFYSHIGWIFVDRHPEIKRRGKLVDMSDILDNPVVMFQKRNKLLLNFVCAYVFPTVIPMLWQEAFLVSFHINILRYILSVNGTFTINSLAHIFGSRPYDKGIPPTENLVTNLATLGEGFHNYHHTFPFDYKAGELGSFLNFSTRFIDFCAWLGFAYDRKMVSEDVVRKRMMRTGDGAEKDKLDYETTCIVS